MTSRREPTIWEQNASEHADERLIGTRDPEWWFTGVRPDADRCPGVGPDGRLTSLPLPDLGICGREEVLDYFDNSWTLQETLFAGLVGAEAFYRPPGHNLRHPMIFYYGHPAVLYVNKLRVGGLLDKPVDEYLEQVLETGVDEMSWDDMSKNEMLWPSVSEVHAYRAEVYQLIVKLIETTDFAPDLGRPITMDDQAWALFLAFEHDRIHLETSSVLIRELPERLVQQPAAWPLPAPMRATTGDGIPGPDSFPENGFVTVEAGTARLGKPHDFPSFGWDNEYGAETWPVEEFDAARFLVSNGEFHRFVADGGYRRPELWSEEGERWRRFGNTKWPRWWVPAGPSGLHAFKLRTTFDVIDMPWNWPVAVNYHEAKAYCAWKSDKDGRSYRLPTEVEFTRMRGLPERPTAADDPVMRFSGAELREQGVNLNLAFGSETPVDTSPASAHGLHDTAGNLWTWCEDVAHALDGFAVHPYYEDFSVPCFDDQHQMILGGAFISTGDEASIWARFHFRPHFLQQSGIRLVAAPEVREVTSAADDGGGADENVYETKSMMDRYLLMHFGSIEDTFDRTDHPLAKAHGYPRRIAEFLTGAAAATDTTLGRVLDVGSAVGGASFALAHNGSRVIGIDLSAAFVQTANLLAGGVSVPYDRVEQGEVTTRRYATAPTPGAGGGATFLIGDACALQPELGAFDGIVLGNLLDRLPDPRACLRQFTESTQFLRAGGLLLIATPWSWQGAYTARENWLGGRGDSGPGDSWTSERGLRRFMADTCDLVAETSMTGVLRDHRRHFEFLDADVTVWRKR